MREAYKDQLDGILDDLVIMTHQVKRAVSQSTIALLTGDAGVAEQVISDDADIDRARERIEDKCFELLSLQQPVAGDLRQIVAGLRMVAELERMGDLAVHVAKVARLRLPHTAVPESIEPSVRRMAAVAQDMVSKVAVVIAERDVDAAREVEAADEEIDKLRRATFQEILDPGWAHGVEPAIDIALLGRYYERIADHAVSLARRVVFLVTGEHPGAQH
ncbi:MAG: phosphate signaling complex protein PhoU [Nocardioides sp.]|nr:phosphate signaling complex protein PhoU [Nocardioides sp.]